MTWLDVFALIVLLVLAATGIAVWVLMGMYPGKIARERKHPQADAIAVCGWWGVITFGLLLPVAWIWAYSNTGVKMTPDSRARDDESACRDGDSSGGAKL